jgi:hypothetical protein
MSEILYKTDLEDKEWKLIEIYFKVDYTKAERPRKYSIYTISQIELGQLDS